MRAAVMRNQRLVVDTVPDPTPGPSEVVVKTLACGICGSDLHALKHAAKLVAATEHRQGRPTASPLPGVSAPPAAAPGAWRARCRSASLDRAQHFFV